MSDKDGPGGPGPSAEVDVHVRGVKPPREYEARHPSAYLDREQVLHFPDDPIRGQRPTTSVDQPVQAGETRPGPYGTLTPPVAGDAVSQRSSESASTPTTPADSETSLPPIDESWEVSRGFIASTLLAAQQDARNLSNPLWARNTLAALSAIAAPVRSAEDAFRSIANIPHNMYVGGQLFARSSLQSDPIAASKDRRDGTVHVAKSVLATAAVALAVKAAAPAVNEASIYFSLRFPGTTNWILTLGGTGVTVPRAAAAGIAGAGIRSLSSSGDQATLAALPGPVSKTLGNPGFTPTGALGARFTDLPKKIPDSSVLRRAFNGDVAALNALKSMQPQIPMRVLNEFTNDHVPHHLEQKQLFLISIRAAYIQPSAAQLTTPEQSKLFWNLANHPKTGIKDAGIVMTGFLTNMKVVAGDKGMAAAAQKYILSKEVVELITYTNERWPR